MPQLRPGKLIAGWGDTHIRVASASHPPSPPQIFRSDKILGDHEVSFLDIAFDEIPERYYRSLEVARMGTEGSSPGPSPCPPISGGGFTAPFCRHPAGPPFLQLGQDGPGAAAGGLASTHQAHHVLLQAGERQVRGVGAADAGGAVCAQGEGGGGAEAGVGGTLRGDGGRILTPVVHHR